MSGLIIAATALLGAAGCSSPSPADAKNTPAPAVTIAGAGARTGAGGPCQATMDHITDAGKKITADAKDRTKATADLQEISDRFASDAEQIKNPEGKAAAKQLSTVYRQLADSAKNNQSPDMKTMPSQIQGAVTALSTCAAAE
ncbi:hypothetical protein ACFVT9_32905 [Kitasatospora cineracea]|uniref:hypothetical protein n=1 Tax=Kitasatospora cineracea TaxID=88074 RepID=UPI0034112C0A